MDAIFIVKTPTRESGVRSGGHLRRHSVLTGSAAFSIALDDSGNVLSAALAVNGRITA